MRRLFKRTLAMVVAVLTVVSCASADALAFSADECSCGVTPTIIVPGLFQAETFLYDENGELAKNSDGEERAIPFFLDSTGDIIKYAAGEVLLPMMKMLLTQRDRNSEFVNATAKAAGKILLERVSSNAQGKTKYDLRAAEYEGSYAKLSEDDKKYVLANVPMQEYFDYADEDHMYFFSYLSLGNMMSITEDLCNLIEQVKSETHHSKVNIVAISQGGSIMNALLEFYPDVYESIDRIIYVVPALDGSDLVGDIFAYGLLDDDEALYRDMFPSLFTGNDAWTGYLVNLLIRFIPKDVLNNLLDTLVDVFVEDYLEYTTCLWALVPNEQYPIAAEKYLSDPEDAEIRRQTDLYYTAQLHSDNNILKAIEKGIEVFDIVDYNYPLYHITDSWQKNGDGIIQIESSSMGATSYGVNVQLPEGYTPENCRCTLHNHIDPHNILDASTGLLPDHTFYFYNQDHEKTGNNDVVMKLAVQLMVDKSFKDVYTYPDRFPQFNTGRNSKSLIKDLKKIRSFDVSALSSADARELAEAIAQCDAVLQNTVVDIDEFNSAHDRFYVIRRKIMNENQDTLETRMKTKARQSLTDLLRMMSDSVYKYFGAKGFFDR